MKSRTAISNPDISAQLLTHMSNFLLNILTWLFNRHLKLKVLQNEFLHNPLPLRTSPSQLMATLSFQFLKSKILKSTLSCLSHPICFPFFFEVLFIVCPESDHFSPSSLLSPWSKPPSSLTWIIANLGSLFPLLPFHSLFSTQKSEWFCKN